jgi:hypothetical protein
MLADKDRILSLRISGFWQKLRKYVAVGQDRDLMKTGRDYRGSQILTARAMAALDTDRYEVGHAESAT